MTNISKLIHSLCILVFCTLCNFSFGQLFFTNTDLSQVKIEKLTEQDIKQIRSELQQKNTTMEAIEPIALSKGMSPANFSLLKTRVQNEAPVINVDIPAKKEEQPIELNVEAQNNPKAFVSKIFGSEIFTNPTLSFEPNSNMATPLNYILGTGDELQIVIYGIQEFGTTSQVSKEGKISIPNVGQIFVNGMTLDAAIASVKSACGKVFSTLRSGQSSISVTLTKIRTIHVTIIGSKKAGNYSVSSLSTVFNALFLAGGPADNGSYRNIELIRGNKVVKKIDIYRFLTTGDQSDNVSLKDNDIIRIPTYECRVSIEGEVKKSGIFELIPGENFNNLLKYCSGFTEAAYLSTIKLTQNTEKELRIVDLTKDQYESYIPKSGDVYKVGIILNRFENRISIKGAVFRPDDYSFVPGMKVSELIKKADGFKEDAYKTSAQITRLKDDFSKEIISINLDKVFSGDSTNDISLKKEDELLIFSLFDFKDIPNVQIGGQIRKPGTYPYVQNLTLFDLILQAGEFTDNASKRIEISRMIKKDEIVKGQIESSQITVVEVADLISDQSKNIPLEPYDIIQIRKMPIYETQKIAKITGFIEYPGEYVISTKNEKVFDIITRAGGLKTNANINGIYIKRGDYIIPINYTKILKKQTSYQNIRIQPDDELVVLKYVAAIKINGSISLNTEIPYVKGKSVRYYVNNAGGFNKNGWKRKVYNKYPNGTASRTKRILFFKIYPKVTPGAEINIPQKPEKEKRDIKEFVAIASVSTSMATMIAVLAKLFQ